MGTANHVPKAPDTVTAQMRVDLFKAVLKTLLPSTEYSRIGIARNIMRPPRQGYPRDLAQSILWFEEFFNREMVARRRTSNDGTERDPGICVRYCQTLLDKRP
eukprot:1590911-Amphidinium_carterae.2